MILVALARAELEAFFPGGLGDELAALVRSHGGAMVDPAAPDWAGTLARLRPSIVVSAWAAPSLGEAAAGHVRYVCHVTGGVRGVVPRRLLEAGVRVTNWGDCAAEPVAEAALMLILAGLRRTQHWGRELHERGGWRTGDGGGISLFDRRVAIHGFGRIARTLIGLLRPFRCAVSVHAAGVPDAALQALQVRPCATLDELVAGWPDVLVELEALTPRTRGTLGERHLRALPRGALFVNCGRGAVVADGAVERIAADGHLRLALDVFSAEPLAAGSPLRGPADVTLMPHLGGPTPDLHPACGRQALANLRRWLAGEPLRDAIDLEAYDRST